MTQRSELQHSIQEFKSVLMAYIANRLFSFKEDGLDGFLKRKMLGTKPTKTNGQAKPS